MWDEADANEEKDKEGRWFLLLTGINVSTYDKIKKKFSCILNLRKNTTLKHNIIALNRLESFFIHFWLDAPC